MGSQTRNIALESIFDEAEQQCTSILTKLTRFSKLMWQSVLVPIWICFILFVTCGFPSPEAVYGQLKLKLVK